MVVPFLPNPVVPQISSYIVCRLRGGKYRFRNGFWVCETERDDEEPTDPPDTDNPSREDDEREDTDDNPIPRPDPPTIPFPSPPPVTNPDPIDEPDRIPIPVPDPRLPKTLPRIPRRRLPSLERPTDEDALLIFQDPVIGVERSSFDRTYGCLLHNPITTSPVVFRVCKQEENGDDEFAPVEDTKRFFEYLIRKTAQTGVQETLVTGCVLTLNLLPTRLFRYAPHGQLAFTFGCNLLTNIASDYLFSSSNAYQSIDGNGHINVKYVDCSPPNDDVPDLTEGLEPKFQDINECFVPIRNFRENEPEQQGMKRQLQIIFEGEPDDKGRPRQKQITLPSPLPVEELTENLLSQNIPETWNFGTVKVEVDIIPYGYIRFYAEEGDTVGGEFSDSVADELLDDLINLIDGSEKTKTDREGNEITTRRYSRRSRNIITGEFTRKKAFLFEWRDGDGQPPLCQTFTF